MELPALCLLCCLLLSVVFASAEGRVFCYRRVKKRGKCGGLLKKLNYATPEQCCQGRGVGFATKKQKVGRNRFVCTPCSQILANVPPTTTTTTTTTTSTTTTPLPWARRHQGSSNSRTNDWWPRPQTQSPGGFTLYPPHKKVEWSEWSPCSATCGAGWRSRFKICDDCDKNDYENVLSAPCMEKFYCPVDGNWGPWFPWQPCSQSCNGGTRVRQRKCNYPPPAYDGQTCPGPASESQECNDQSCPVDGAWSPWSQFSQCSATCGQGFKQRERTCDNPAPAHGGRECPGSDVLTRKCEVAKCPQDGEWSLWSSWSQCTATCGQGVRTRTRACNSPRPMHGGKDCEGESVMNSHCFSTRPCPINGGWSEWNGFSFCRAPRCDWGFRIRTRLCSNPRPQHGGAHCQGNQYERVECFNELDCPRNGSWCEWSPWSACSSSCAEQTSLQVRQRACSCPEPRFGGNDCEGDSLAVRDCTDLAYCNIDEKEDGAGENEKTRKCGDGALEGSGNEEDCDQEEEEEGVGRGSLEESKASDHSEE